VRTGPFEQTLDKALHDLGQVDLAYLDGNHRLEPTLEYFEKCLVHAHDETIIVLDDVHWSEGMTEAWRTIQAHPRVRMTLDLFDISIVFINPNIREKQHYSIVPYRWKPWRAL
jgi:predicted O-methyltransferase YrrM